MTRRRVGFTLIELLVVIGVIAILLSFLAPVVHKVRMNARSLEKQNRMRAYIQGEILYAIDHKDRFSPSVATIRNSGNEYPWGWMEPMTLTTYPEEFYPFGSHRAKSEYLTRAYIQDSAVTNCTMTPNPHPYGEKAWEAGDGWMSPDNRDGSGNVIEVPSPHFSSFSYYGGGYTAAVFVNGRKRHKPYIGPRKASEKGMLISDTFIEDSDWRSPGGGITSCEPFRQSGSDGRKSYSSNLWWKFKEEGEPLDFNMLDINMHYGNAGGDVQKFAPDEDLYIQILKTPNDVRWTQPWRGNFYIPWEALYN